LREGGVRDGHPRGQRRSREEGALSDRGLDGESGREGQARGRRARRRPVEALDDHQARGPRRMRPRHRGDRREPRRQEGSLLHPRPGLRAARDLLLEHLVADDHGDLGGDRPSGPIRRPPLLQPGAGHEARRGRPHDRDLRGDREDRLRFRDLARQTADPRARQLGLRGQPASRSVSPRRGPGARRGRRDPRGYRQGNGAGVRPPDGAAAPARFRRARHDLRDRRDHVQRVPGEALRAAAPLEAHGAGGALRQENRPRLLRVRRGPMSGQLIRVETAEGIRTLTVDRPEKLNALNAAVQAELSARIAEAETDPGLRCLILTGAGEKAFIAGADIGELAKLTPVEGREHARRGQALLNRIERLPVPTIAAINGYAYGGGLEIAMACTLRVASENAKMGLPETGLGILPGYGGTQRMARLLGTARAAELILTAEKGITAAEAHRLGLVNRVFPAGGALAGALELARAISRNGPAAVRYALEAIRE